jgi:hypothetical protein
MVDLSALIQAAHGGDAASSLASQFGLSPEQANSAIAALSPALAQGFQNHLQSPEGLAQIFSHLTDSTHIAAFADPSVAQAPETAGAGGDLLSQIFGGSAGVSQIAHHIATETGIDPSVFDKLMPVVASMAAGGVAKSLQDSGLGGLLSQLGGAAGQGSPSGQSGGFGSILGQLANSFAQGGQPGAQAGSQGSSGGGLGGLFGGVLGSLFGQGASAAVTPGSPPSASGLDPAMVQAAMNALGGLFQSSGSTSGGLQNVLAQVLAKR